MVVVNRHIAVRAVFHRAWYVREYVPDGFALAVFMEWFANYTTIVADALGDRVKDFITINEPQCIIGSG